MPRAIKSFNGQKSVTVRFGFHGRDPATNEPSIGTIEQLIPDGDTINVSFLPGDDIGVRFLGIDTPEKTLPVPGGDPKDFVSLTDAAWVISLMTHSATGLLLPSRSQAISLGKSLAVEQLKTTEGMGTAQKMGSKGSLPLT
jgi:hypothetical protein